MEGVTGIADDMIIAGKDEMEHDRNFLAFMEKCMENNLTLNAEKIQFKQKQVSFYGHVWSDQGISPDPKKIQALKHMEFPPDKETVRSFLGMINYLNRYSALSAHLTVPLISLTHQATDYKPERNYIELTPGMAVWVQHRQNTSWEPATVVSQSSSNSYWIMQENGTDQPRVYRRTRSMLKIRSTDV